MCVLVLLLLAFSQLILNNVLCYTGYAAVLFVLVYRTDGNRPTRSEMQLISSFHSATHCPSPTQRPQSPPTQATCHSHKLNRLSSLRVVCTAHVRPILHDRLCRANLESRCNSAVVAAHDRLSLSLSLSLSLLSLSLSLSLLSLSLSLLSLSLSLSLSSLSLSLSLSLSQDITAASLRRCDQYCCIEQPTTT